jgi:hypothetical protein
MQLQQEQQAQQQAQQPVQAQPSSIGGMPQQSQADIERMIAEKAPQLLQQHLESQIQQMQDKQFIDSFFTKMQAAEQKHPGLEKKLSGFTQEEYHAMAPVLKVVNSMDNTGDIIKELLDNPVKMMMLINSAEKMPTLLSSQVQELSNSIRMNQDALAQETQARDPMSQLKPSSTAGMDNSSMSVTQMRQMFKRRR